MRRRFADTSGGRCTTRTPRTLEIDVVAGAVILVVDDEASQRELLAGFLAARGFRVHEAADGQAALDRVLGGGVDVVLLDERMPRLAGLAACRRLHAFDPKVVVVVMTAYASEEAAAEALEAGAVAYMRKPLDLERLETVIRAGLERRALASAE